MTNSAARILAATLSMGMLAGWSMAQEPAKPASAPKVAPKAEPEKKTPPAAEPAKTEPAKDAKKDDARKDESKDAKKDAGTKADANTRYVLGHTMKTIDGKDINLADYKGKVVLIVNVASKCGYTKQYEGLEKLYKDKSDKGLVVLGIPANNFGGQEPGSDAEIAKFCSANYGVTFPMLAKVSAKGADQHPLFKQLAGQPAPVGGDPKWNFTKFLVDREGNVVARFDSGVAPADKELTSKVDELLKAPAGK